MYVCIGGPHDAFGLSCVCELRPSRSRATHPVLGCSRMFEGRYFSFEKWVHDKDHGASDILWHQRKGQYQTRLAHTLCTQLLVIARIFFVSESPGANQNRSQHSKDMLF